MRLFANLAILALMSTLAWVPSSPADELQSDWSGGAGMPGPVAAWDRGFATATGVSWLAVPGQLALSSSGLAVGVPHLLADGQAGAFGVGAADLDADGDVDIVGAAELAGDLTVWWNDGASPPSFTAQVVDGAYANVSGVCVADLDGDGDPDLVACTGSIASRITCYLNGGGSPPVWTPRNLETNWSESWEIAAGDVDGDGHPDVIGTNLGEGDVVWWRNDGAEPIGWTRQMIDASFGGAHSARAGDIDGDGRVDILATGTVANQVAWWRNEGGAPITWTKRVIASGFFGGRSVRLGDIDGDGDLDAAACGFSSRVTWWANEGGTPVAWTEQLISASVGLAHQLQLADVSGDGRLDVVAAAYGGNSLAWFANGGGTAPISWTRFNVDMQFARPLAVDTGDVDGDGALEIISSSNQDNLFRWYDATAFVAAGELTGSVLDFGAAGPLLLDWTAVTPPGTGVQFEVRSGSDPSSLGPWSAPVAAAGYVLDPVDRYLQYRVRLATADTTTSPRLAEVAVRRALSSAPQPAVGARLGIHPNPSNPRTIVTFDLPRATRVELVILDLGGRLVRPLVDAALGAGRHEVPWDGTDAGGRAVASGVYLASLTTARGTQCARLTLVR